MAAGKNVIVGGLLVLIGVGVVLRERRWVSNVWHGPQPVTPEALSRLTDPASLPNQWVSLDFGNMEEAGLSVSKSYGEEERYVLIQVGDGWLVAVVPATFSGNHVDGYLEKWSTPYYTQILEKIYRRVPTGARLVPYQMDSQYPQRQNLYGMLGIVAFLILAGVGLATFTRPARPSRTATTAGQSRGPSPGTRGRPISPR